MQNISKRFNGFLSFLLTSGCCLFFILSPIFSYSQALCTGKLGAPTIFKGFGSGTPAYNTAPASTFGFSTTFTIWNKQNTQDGFYSIVNSIPNDFSGIWHTGGLDHTPGDVNGYMLLVNGDQTLGEFYRDTAVGLCAGSSYEFSSYLANVFRPAGSGVPTSNAPRVRFEIRDMTNTVLFSANSGNINTSAAFTWNKFGISFNAPSSPLILVMVSTAPPGVGNDIVIDDIAFAPCMPVTTVTKKVSVCENNNTNLTVDVTGNPDFRYSQWQKSRDKGLTWIDTGAAITQTGALISYSVNLNLTNASLREDSTLYRLILSTNPAYLATPSSPCNAISDTSLLVVNKYPILVTSDTTVCNTPIDLTLPTFTKGSTFPANTVLSYYTTLANATASTNAISTANVKAITNTAPAGTTYFIRAATTTSPTCAVIEPITLTINPLRSLTLAPQLPVCKDSAVFTSTATIQNISGISWQKSTSASALQTGAGTSLLVTPTVADLANDSIWIIATSTDNVATVGACPNVKDSIKVKFFEAPTIDAPADTAFCLNKPLVLLPLKATMRAANEIVWTTSASVKPTPLTGATTSLAISGAIDETIYIVAKTKGCRTVIDSVNIKTEVIDTIDVTGPVKVCRNNPLVEAVLTSTSTAGILWQANGSGFSPNASANSIIYTPTAAEIASTSVKLKAVTLLKPSQMCPSVSDSIEVAVFVEPSLQLPTDTTLCFAQNPTLFGLSSVLANADSLIWRTNTAIIPNPKKGSATSLSIPSTTSFKVFGTAYKKGCIPIQDSLTVSLETPPKVTVTPTFTCLPNLQVDLIGAASITNTGLWSSSGNGNFGSTPTVLSPNSYIPSKQDSTKGDVMLTLTTIGQIVCPAHDTSFLWKIIPLPKASAGNDTLVCIGSTISRKTISNNDWTYEWRTSAAGSVIGTNPIFSFTANQDSSTFLTVRNSRLCVATDNSAVTIEQKPKVSATPTFTCLPNLQVDLSGTSSVTGSGIWSSSGNGSFGSATSDLSPNSYIPSNQDSTKGDVMLTLSSTGQIVCQADDTTFLWKIIPLPKASAGNDTLVCISSSITRKTISNADWTYEWRTSSSGSVVGANPSFAFLASQDSSTFLTVRNSRLCVVTDNSAVTIEQKPKVSATPTFTCLPNLQVDLVGTSSVTGSGIWSSSGNGSFGSADTDLSPNSYIPSKQDSTKGNVTLTLTTTGQIVCPAKDTSFLWKIIPLPKASAGNDTLVCVNSNISIASISNPDWKYEWRKTASGAIASNTNTFSFLANIDTTNIFLTVRNSRNCVAKDSSSVATITPPTISLPTQICLYTPRTMAATVTNPPASGTYEWFRNDKPTGITANSLLLDTTAKYSYRFSFKGCTSSNDIFTRAIPELVVKDTSACQNANTAFIANLIPQANYYWGPSKITNGTHQFTINAGNGISNFEIFVIDQNGCRDSVQSNISILPFPTFTLAGSDLCPSETKNIVATLDIPSITDTNAISFAWKRNGIPISAPQWEKLTYSEAGNYNLRLGVKGCFVDNSIQINFHPNPKINIPLVYKHCFETDPPLALVSNPFKNYVWRSENGIIDTTQSVPVTPERDSYYFLAVKNDFGCKDSTKVLVRKVCPPRLFVPNVITPESQDVNAGLKIFGANYTNFEITVFSRWGEVIFNSKDPNHEWNGEYLNDKMPIGNYQWLVTYEGDTEEYKGPYKKTGDVALVR